MKYALSIILALTFALPGFTQSGRVKPVETPTPDPQNRTIVYNPTQEGAGSKKIKSTPTPAPKTVEGDDVIKVDSILVPIPVSVLDATGKAIANLKLEDFELRVGGKVEVISEIARSETPVRLALLFDNSSSVLIAREFEKKAAIRFFNRVIRPEKDLVALFSVSTVTRLEQPFTKNVDQLTAAIELFPQPEGATALLDGLIDAAKYLKEAQGRRVVVIVSDGDDTSSDATLEESLKALQIANCQVFVVKTTDFENNKRTGQRGGNANIRQLAAERRMQEIAKQTGGAVYSPIDEDELDKAFRQISAELAQQYILSYYPEEGSETPGEFRPIMLSVKNRQNVEVRTRNGYYVPKRQNRQ
jgi:Ca-activated chloride channel family protein